MKLDKFLFQYRVTPHTTTGVSPAELMFGRKLRTVFDLVHPNKGVKETVLSKQESQKAHYDATIPRELNLQPEPPVIVRNYSTVSKDLWVPAKVLKQTGPVSYKCELPGGTVVRRHQNQILTRSDSSVVLTPTKTVAEQSQRLSTHSPIGTETSEGVQAKALPEVSVKPATPIRRSMIVKPPDRLDL